MILCHKYKIEVVFSDVFSQRSVRADCQEKGKRAALV